MRFATILVITAAVFAAIICRNAQAAALLEMQVEDQTFRGKVIAHDKHTCWLMDRSGQLSQLQLSKIGKHRSLESRFRRYSKAEVRDQLRREFGPDYEVVGTGHYLVCAVRGRAKQYAPVFEEIYRTFQFHFSRRGFRVSEPEFPLVAVIFPNHTGFARYSKERGVTAIPGLMGYYQRMSNRVALFDPSHETHSSSTGVEPADSMASIRFDDVFSRDDRAESPAVLPSDELSTLFRVQRHGDVASNLKNTIIHETVHQVAFNTGLHSRIGANPTWVVEGLATVMEAPGIRDNTSSRSSPTRWNRERLIHFRNYMKKRRKDKSLAKFIGSDDSFRRQTLDAYSQAWALSFFLMETRASAYTSYLRNIAQRDPLEPYDKDARHEDFRIAFGDDLDWLEVEFLRFAERLR